MIRSLATQLLGMAVGALVGTLSWLLRPHLLPLSSILVYAWAGQVLAALMDRRGQQGCLNSLVSGCVVPYGVAIALAVADAAVQCLGLKDLWEQLGAAWQMGLLALTSYFFTAVLLQFLDKPVRRERGKGSWTA